MKVLVIIALVVAGIAALIFVGAGTPFVLNIVKHRIETGIQQEIDVPISIGSLRGNLLYALEIRDVDLDSTVMLSKGTVTYDVFKLLSRKIKIKNLALERLYVDINRLERFNMTSSRGTQQTQSGFSIDIERLSLRQSTLSGEVNDIPLSASIQLDGYMTPQHVVIETLTIQTEQSRFSGQGTIPRTDAGSLDVAYALDLLLDEVPVEHLSGRLQGSGRLTGSTENPRIESELACNGDYQENEFTGTAVVRWQTPSFDSLFVDAQIDARMPSLKQNAKKRDVLRTQISAQGQQFLCTVASPYGTLNLDGLLDGTIDNPVMTADLDATVSYGQLAPEVRARIGFRDQIVTVTRLRVQDKKITLNANASLSTAPPQGITADMTADCRDISFLSSFIETMQPVSGAAHITARAAGTLTNPNINATVRIEDAVGYDETVTAADFVFAFQNSILSVSQGNIQSPRGALTATGTYKVADSTFTIRLHSDSLRFVSPEVWGTDTIPISGTIQFDAELSGAVNNPKGRGSIYFSNVAYDTMHFENHRLSLSLHNQIMDLVLTNERLNMYATGSMKTVAPYEFNTLIRMHEFALERFVGADTALLTGSVALEGFLDDIEKTEGKATVSRLEYSKQGYRLENKDTLVITLENDNLGFDAFALTVQGQAVTVQGHIPRDFRIGTFDVVCAAERFDLAPLVTLIPDAPNVRGLLSINAAFTGTLKEPEISGELSVHNGALTVPDLMLDSINGDITFHRDIITVEQLTGQVNRGTFNTRGQIHLEKEKLDLMSLETVVEKAEYRNNEYGKYTVSGELKTSSQHDSIFLTGDITVDDGVYDIPFNVQTIIRLLTSVNRPVPEQSDILKQIYCDFGITAPDGVRIKNNVADVTADVDLQVRGSLARINVYGRITTPQTGTVKYLGKKFDIVNATIEFDNPYTVDPVLNLEATTFVSSIDGDYDITLFLSGTIENWRLTLSSNPPVPEQDIISLVLIGRRRPTIEVAAGGEGFSLTGTARDYALDLARGNIERTAEKAFGLDKVVITGDLLAPRDLSIGIEKKLSRRLTFVYGTGIESWELHRIGFNYDITDNLSIFTLHDQENLNSSVDLDIHLDIE